MCVYSFWLRSDALYRTRHFQEGSYFFLITVMRSMDWQQHGNIESAVFVSRSVN